MTGGGLFLPSWQLFLLQPWRVLPQIKTQTIKDKNEKTKETSQESLMGQICCQSPLPLKIPKTAKTALTQPAQKSPTPWKGQQRGPATFESDRVGKYAKYFKGNEILPIPEIIEKLTPRILSLVISDLKTKGLWG